MGASTDSYARRAERLRVALTLCGGMPLLDPGEQVPLLSPADLLVLGEPVTDEDLALVNACLEVAQELRRRSFEAVERLLAVVAGTMGNLTEHVTSLPYPQAMQALGDLSEAGWIYGEPDAGA